ncbi:MAG TPA: hypothetical protein ENI20_18425 [Bacteroides sp.]|nr:hypothetical protein [Bacteroides sp.]
MKLTEEEWRRVEIRELFNSLSTGFWEADELMELTAILPNEVIIKLAERLERKDARDRKRKQRYEKSKGKAEH